MATPGPTQLPYRVSPVIAGESITDAASRSSYRRENPADVHQIVTDTVEASLADVRAAVQAARDIFDGPPANWTQNTQLRRQVLLETGRLLRENTEAPTATPTPCGAFAGGGPGSGILTIAQQPTAALAYPDGAGLPITAHQGVHLEMHYLNAGDQPLAIGGTVTLELADAGAALAPVALTFTGNSAISIAAHTTAHLTSEHALPAGTRLFATTAHTHQWGRRATVELLRTAGDPSPLVLHDSTDWADRPLDQFAPITVGPDARLRLTCDFDNQSNQTVNFGLSAEDEMCFLWAHHVPQ